MKIASLLPSATEIVYALGLGDDLIGVTDECDYPPDAVTKPVISRSALPQGRIQAPREIDEVLLQHPAVGEAVAFGSPHPAWGEEVAAAVVLKEPVDEKELLAFARERLADYKVPSKLYVVDAIPRTATGKIQRRSVAEALTSR